MMIIQNRNMIDNFKYKIIDYVNINHHNSDEVQTKLNELGMEGFELISIIDLGIDNTNKDGKSARFRYIFKKRITNEK